MINELDVETTTQELEVTTQEENTTPAAEQPTSPAQPKTTDVEFNFDSSPQSGIDPHFPNNRGHSITLSLANDDGSDVKIDNSDKNITIEEVSHKERCLVLYVENILIDYKGSSTITINYGKYQKSTFTIKINWNPNYVASDQGGFLSLNDSNVYLQANTTSYPLSYICYNTQAPYFWTNLNIATINEVDDCVFDVNVQNNEGYSTNKTFKVFGQAYSAEYSSTAVFNTTLNFTQYNTTGYYIDVDEEFYEVKYSDNGYLLNTLTATQIVYTFNFTSNASIIWSPVSSRENCTVSVNYDETTGLGTCIVSFDGENTGGIRIANFQLWAGANPDIFFFEIHQNKPITDGYITINTPNNVVSYNDNSVQTINFTLNNCIDDSTSYSTNSEWINLKSLNISQGSGTIEFTTKQNERAEERKGLIYITSKSKGGVYTSTSVNIVQLPTLSLIEFPIWQDVDILLNDENPLSKYVAYQLIINDEVVYNGRVFKIDDKGAIIRVNDILRSFINEKLDLTKKYQLQSNNSHYTFILNIQNTDGLFYPYKQLRVFNDNSYNAKTSYTSKYVSDFIQEYYDKRQLLLISVEDFADNIESTLSVHGILMATLEYQKTVMDEEVKVVNDVATFIVPLHNFTSNPDSSFNKEIKIYPLKNTCKPFCLYWRNIYGGYNSFLFNDASKQSDLITNYDIRLENNNTTLDYSRKQYMKEVQEKWTIKTDYINDAQARVLKYIVHSPEVYLHDLVNDNIIPVLITDSSLDHKQYRNNSRKLLTYTFTLENSNIKIIQ